MSFKKKTVVISGNSGIREGSPIIPGRAPITASGPAGRGPPMVGIPPAVARAVPGRGPVPGRESAITSIPQINQIMNHEGVKPSLQTSTPTISTGSTSLDKLLGHGGLPLGSLLAIEESGSTDFASVVLRGFASQGIIHSRLDKNHQLAPTKIVVVGGDETWGNELPGVYKDKKQAAKELIRKEESKISVGNLANEGGSPAIHSASASTHTATAAGASTSSMKIAWRYSQGHKQNTSAEVESSKPNYSTQFDFTSRLIPRPSPNEITYIQVKNTFATIVTELETIAKQAINANTIIRVVIPSLLHPAIYPPHLANPNELFPFIHSLRNLTRKYSNTLAILVSLPLQLFPRESALIRWFELVNDGVLHLEPFPEDVINELKEGNASDITSSSKSSKTSSSSSSSPQPQGLIHIYKLPLTSEKGVMAVRKGEHSFRVGRRQFEIQEWGIPIEEGELEEKKLDY